MLYSELSALVGGTHQPAVERRLAEFEAALAVELPSALRELIARSTGAEMSTGLQAEYATPIYEQGFGRFFVDRFLTLSDEERDSVRPLSVYLADYGAEVDGVSPEIVCIADDGFGNVITIDLRKETHDNVAFVDHEFIGHRSGISPYQVVAGSFEQFVAMLEPVQNHESEVDAQ